MTQPLVSVIIPTYNRAPLVLRAVRSVLAQDYPRLEVIVVDDGSTDGTAELLESEVGDEIRVIRQANAGVSTARNTGLATAKGDILGFLDSDDQWLPTKTTRQVDYLARHPEVGMVVCDYNIVDEQGDLIVRCRRRKQYGPDGWVLPNVVRNPILVPSTILLRRSVYLDVGGFDPDLRTAEDLDLHLRISASHQIGVVDEALVTYLRGAGSLSDDVSSYSDYVFVVRRFVAGHRDRLSPRDAREAVFGAQFKLARGLMWEGEASEALRAGARCLPQVSGVRDGLALGELVLRVAAGKVRGRFGRA